MPKSQAAEDEGPSLWPVTPLRSNERQIDFNEINFEQGGVDPAPAMIRIAEKLGVHTPVLVVREEQGYRLIDDPRWLRAMIEAGLQQVPARILDLGGWENPELITLLLGASQPANLAVQMAAYQALRERGHSDAAIRRATGFSRSRLEQLDKLTKLEPRIKSAWLEDRVRPTIATGACKLPEWAQGELADRLDERGQLTTSDVQILKVKAGLAAPKAPKDEEEVIDDAAGPEEPEQIKRRVATHLRSVAKMLARANEPTMVAELEQLRQRLEQESAGRSLSDRDQALHEQLGGVPRQSRLA